MYDEKLKLDWVRRGAQLILGQERTEMCQVEQRPDRHGSQCTGEPPCAGPELCMFASLSIANNPLLLAIRPGLLAGDGF